MPEARAHIVYVDANPIAYALEAPDELASVLKGLFALFKEKPGIALTSELTLAEVLPKRRVPDRQFFELLIWNGIFDLYPVTRDILVETADYRRVAGGRRPDGSVALPKLPDAIHVVTAIQNNCDIFLSSDLRIKLPTSMKFVQANAAGIAGLLRELA